MYLGSQLDSLYDEKSWGSDSYSSSSSLYKVQQNWTSYGNFSSSDYKDYYQFSSSVGDFTLYVTGDSTNGFATSTPNYLFSIKMLDSSGKDIGIAASSFDTSTKSISYTAPSDQTYYLEIDNTIGSSFSYAATLQPSYSSSPTTPASLDGTNGNDYLVGTSGEDDLMGGFGTDTLVGGSGNDIYYVNANSNIIENSNGGTDEVFTNSSGGILAESLTYFKLPANVENIFDFGNRAFYSDGNELNNFMCSVGTGQVIFFGQGGDDTLYGGEGNDDLNGGLGVDTARFMGKKSDYTVSKNGDNYTVNSVAEGTDTLTNIEYIYVGGVSYAIDSLLAKTNSAPTGNGTATLKPATFAPQATFAVGSNPNSVSVADVNVDGNTDVVTANSESDNVSVLMGDGRGNFAPQTTFAVDGYPNFVSVADVNGDGNADIVTANATSFSLLVGDGRGNFAAQATPAIAISTNPASVSVADVNGDGNADVVMPNWNSSNISVLMGDGRGNFAAQITFAVGYSPNSVSVADVNSDGNVDVVTANNNSDNVSVLMGDG